MPLWSATQPALYYWYTMSIKLQQVSQFLSGANICVEFTDDPWRLDENDPETNNPPSTFTIQ